MNINDIKSQESTKDKLVEIFEKQRSLMEKYEEIEEKNGLLQTKDIPVNLHDRFGQARIKDFFWRATEEICEALEAKDNKDIEHFKEEIADALHFFVEASILAGIKPSDFKVGEDKDILEYLFEHNISFSFSSVEEYAMYFIKHIGLAANCLKNKPWKTSHMLTDEDKFYHHMYRAWCMFIRLCDKAEFTADTLYDYYFRKNEVNKFRQRSGY